MLCDWAVSLSVEHTTVANRELESAVKAARCGRRKVSHVVVLVVCGVPVWTGRRLTGVSEMHHCPAGRRATGRHHRAHRADTGVEERVTSLSVKTSDSVEARGPNCVVLPLLQPAAGAGVQRSPLRAP